MKKRIGTNIYDTEKAVLALPPDLYRKKNSFVFFRFDGEKITPIERDTAGKIIRESGNKEALKYIEYSNNDGRNLGTLRINLNSLKKLSDYCRKNNVTQKDVIERFIDSLPDSPDRIDGA